MGLPLLVGVSLGSSLAIGIGLLAQGPFKSKFFPDDPSTKNNLETFEKVLTRALAENSSTFERIARQQMRQQKELIQDLIELNRQNSHQTTPTATPGVNANIFELSQIIEANDLASENRYRREMDELRQALIREHLLKVEGERLKIENKYKPVLGKIKELNALFEAQSRVLQSEAPARILWLTCQALLAKLKSANHEPIKMEPAYDVLQQFVADNHPLATSILASIPKKVLEEGVQSEESLIERFSKVERVCKRVAMVGESGGGLVKYLVSYFQSLFIIDNVKVSEDEVAGRQLVDPRSWNTFDILARVKYCLREHNLEQAIRYANQLRGQARVVARDWIRDAIAHLEMRQAFSALSTHAEAIALDSVRQMYVN